MPQRNLYNLERALQFTINKLINNLKKKFAICLNRGLVLNREDDIYFKDELPLNCMLALLPRFACYEK